MCSFLTVDRGILLCVTEEIIIIVFLVSCGLMNVIASLYMEGALFVGIIIRSFLVTIM